MTDIWYAQVNNNGIAISVYCDDTVKHGASDVQLDPAWYYGRIPSVCPTNFIGQLIYKVEGGRLAPTVSVADEMVTARQQKEVEFNNYEFSATLSDTKKANLGAARQEAEDHMDSCINPSEIYQTLLIGY